MRISKLAYGCLILAFAACNNAGSSSQTTTADTTKTDTTKVMHMDTTAAATAQPAVPAGAKVFFKNLKDGQTVTDPFKVEMGVSGMAVDTAGKLRPASGHHHLLIDDGDSLATGTIVPKDSTHLHFGNAQTETVLNLPAGKHKLTLQFADGLHRSYGSQMAATITVNVKK